MEIIPAEFARKAGVSRAAVSEKIKKKMLIVNAAGFLDTDNPLNAAYIAKHRRRQEMKDAVQQINTGFNIETSKVNSQAAPAYTPDDFSLMAMAGLPAREMLNMTIRDIVLKYPGLDKIERYSKILKDATMSAEREQRIQERGLTLVSKDFVISRLFSFLENLVKQIVEYPEGAVDRLIALANTESETTRIDIVETMTSGLSQIVSGAKDQIIAELNGLKNKYQKDILQNDQFEIIKEVIQEAQGEA